VDPVSEDTPFRATPMADLIEESSLGSAATRQARRRTPPAVKQQLLANLLRQMDDESGGPRCAGPAHDVAAPYLFLSYARRSGASVEGELTDVRRFFHLLCVYLSQLAADIAPDEGTSSPSMVPGYLAGDSSAGASSPPRLLQALSSCRVFVPLLSAGYFGSGSCRREWESFKRRDDLRRQRHPFGLSAIVPVLWVPFADVDLPEWAADMSIIDTTLSREYAQRGIHALMVENDLLYRKTVYRMARRIHDVAEWIPASVD
jgi:hypothetical protein